MFNFSSVTVEVTLRSFGSAAVLVAVFADPLTRSVREMASLIVTMFVS